MTKAGPCEAPGCAASNGGNNDGVSEGVRRRDFLDIAPVAFAGTGAAIAAWPLIGSINPSAIMLAQTTIKVDLEPIELAHRVVVVSSHLGRVPLGQREGEDHGRYEG